MKQMFTNAFKACALASALLLPAQSFAQTKVFATNFIDATSGSGGLTYTPENRPNAHDGNIHTYSTLHARAGVLGIIGAANCNLTVSFDSPPNRPIPWLPLYLVT